MPDASTPLQCRSCSIKSANTSSPTQPETAGRTPSRARQVATLAAHPPESSRKSSVARSSPAAGSAGNGGTKISATRIPVQSTLGARGLKGIVDLGNVELTLISAYLRHETEEFLPDFHLERI